MANDRLVDASKLDAALAATADAIREKTGNSAPITFDYAADTGFADAVDDIQTGAEPVVEALTITEDGTYAAPEGVDGYSPITVSENILNRFMRNQPMTITSADLTGVTGLGSYFNHKTNIIGYNIVIPDTVTSISQNGMYGSVLEIIQLSSGMTKIEPGTFYECFNMKITKIPDGITSIGNNAFMYCTGLTSLEMSSGLTGSIGNTVFRYCSNLESVVFKVQPSSIGTNCFGNCPKLTSIKVPWLQGAVSGAPWGAASAAITYGYSEG